MTHQVEAWEKDVTEQGLRLAELKTDMVCIKDLLSQMKNNKPSSFGRENSVNKKVRNLPKRGNSGFEEERDFLPCSWANNVELLTFEGSVIKNHTLRGEETKTGEGKLERKTKKIF